MLAAQMGVFFHRNRLNPYKKIIGFTVSLRRLMINFQRRKPVVFMRSPIFSSSVTLLAAVIRLSLASPAQAAAFLWNEATDGDWSDNGLTPTQLGESFSAR